MLSAILVIAVVIMGFQIAGLKRRMDELQSRLRDRENRPTTPIVVKEDYSFTPAAPGVPVTSAVPATSYSAPLETTPPATVTPEAVPQLALAPDANLTGKGLAIVGVVALLFGLGFFLKYAFDQNLITQTGRVIIGLVLGLAFLATGDLLSFKEKYREYSFFISGGGLAILYLSIYGAFGYYHIIGQPLAFVGMILATFLGTVVGVHAKSVYLTGLALFGGFLTPLLVSSGVNNQIALFGYIIILDLGFLALSYFKQWEGLYPIVFLGTYGLFFGWLGKFYTPEQFWSTLSFLSLYFVIFLLAPLLRTILKKESLVPAAAVFLNSNAIIYFITSYFLLGRDYDAMRGPFFGAWGAFFLLFAWSMWSAHKEDRLATWSLAGLGLTLLTLVIPIELKSFSITMAWACEALLLAGLGLGFRSKLLRGYSHLLAAITFLHLIAFDSSRALPLSATAFSNERFFAYLVVIAAFLGIAYLQVRFKEAAAGEPQALGAYFTLGILLALLAVHMEVEGFDLSVLIVTASWLLGSLVLIGGGFLARSRGTRITGLLVYAAAIGHLVILDGARFPAAWVTLVNPRFATFLLAVLVSYALAYLYRQRADDMPADERYFPGLFGVAANLLTVWGISLEIMNYFGRFPGSATVANQLNLSLSLFWGLYAAILMLIGIVRKTRSIRILGLCGISLVVLKVFLYDSAQLSDIYRIISFITLGVILLVISFIFYKYKEQVKEFILA